VDIFRPHQDAVKHLTLTRAETLFNSAAQLEPSVRASFLDHACAGDPALRARVEELLGAAAEAGGFLPDHPQNSIRPDPQRTMPMEPGECLGEWVGRYKLLEKLGEGGCGVVYLAQQEEPVRRRVALKVIKLGMDTRQVVARFEAERQALALMDHPNIAKVLDGGTTEHGHTLFVLEDAEPGRIRVFDFRTGRELSPPLMSEDGGRLGALVVASDGRTVACRNSKGNLCLWDVGDLAHGPKALPALRATSRGFPFALLPETRTILTLSGDGTVLGWDLTRDRQPRQPVKVDINTDVANYQLHADGKALLIVTHDGRRPIRSLQQGWLCTLLRQSDVPPDRDPRRRKHRVLGRVSGRGRPTDPGRG